MRDLKDRLRALDLIQAPDLRDRVRRLQPGPPPVEPVFRRLGVVLVAFAIAAGGIAFAIEAFRSTVPPAQSGTTIQDGRIAFSSGPDADIFVVWPDGTGLTRLVARHARGQTGGVQMAWSPDGQKLAFTDYRRDDSVGLYVMEADGGAPLDISPSLQVADSPTWSPDGTQLAFGGCCDAGYEIYVIGADGSGLRRITDERDNGVDGGHMPAWSPDGTRIACVVTRYDAGSQTETSGILVMGADGSHPEFVTHSSEIDESPIWSPDGTKIAFLRKTADGYVQAFVASAAGALTEPTRLSSVHATSLPNWAPDSQEVLFSAQRGIYAVSIIGPEEEVLLEDAYARGAVWSPDGSWIAFVRDDVGSGLVAIWLMRPDGTGQTEAVGGLEDAGGIEWQPSQVDV